MSPPLLCQPPCHTKSTLNTSLTQISRNVIWPYSLYPLTTRLEILHRTLKRLYHTLYEISERLDKQESCYDPTSFREIWVQDFSYLKTPKCAGMPNTNRPLFIHMTIATTTALLILWQGNPSVTGGFPSQRDNNAELTNTGINAIHEENTHK